jgi:hypothetical protein
LAAFASADAKVSVMVSRQNRGQKLPTFVAGWDFSGKNRAISNPFLRDGALWKAHRAFCDRNVATILATISFRTLLPCIKPVSVRREIPVSLAIFR